LRVGVFCSRGHGSESVGACRGTPKTQPDVYRPGKRGAPARAVVRAQHAPVAQPDRQVHGRVEPHAVPAKVPAARVQERAVLVQEPPGKVQTPEDVPVRRNVAERPVLHAHVPQSRLMLLCRFIIIIYEREEKKKQQYNDNSYCTARDYAARCNKNKMKKKNKKPYE